MSRPQSIVQNVPDVGDFTAFPILGSWNTACLNNNRPELMGGATRNPVRSITDHLSGREVHLHNHQHIHQFQTVSMPNKSEEDNRNVPRINQHQVRAPRQV